MENLKLRAVCGSDYPAVSALYAYVHAIHEENRPDLFNALEEPLTAAMFGQICADSDGVALCAVQGGRIAGFAYTRIKPPSTSPIVRPRVTAYMEDLVVHPGAQRTGVGRALFEETRRLAAARGAVSLELKVWAFNRNAQEFYGRMGMRPRSVIMEMPLAGIESFPQDRNAPVENGCD